MKKLLLIMSVFVTTAVFAQKDISTTLTTPTPYSAIINGIPVSPSGKIVNLGPALTAQDTIFVIMCFNQNGSLVPITHTVNGTAGIRWGANISHGAVATNGVLDFTVTPSLPFNITTFSGASICAVAYLQNGGNVDVNIVNNSSCNQVTMTVNAGINDMAAISNSVKVFPNPAKDVINFAIEGNLAKSISVMDITGKLIENVGTSFGESQINLNNYSSGIYLYQIKAQDGQLIKSGKFTVSK